MGMIKLENPVLYRKAALCDSIDRELMSVLGIDRYETSARTGSARIQYDPRQLGPAQIIGILDEVLANAEHPGQLDRPELDLAICTASVPLAAVAQFAIPDPPSGLGGIVRLHDDSELPRDLLVAKG